VHDQTGIASFKTIEKLASHGGRKQVRLRSDIFWEGVNGKWSWRDLATLCAVYAGIGANQMTRLSFDYIAVMALGFSSKDELSAAKQESNRLNRKKTGYTVRTLASRGFFVSASPNYRHVWYSNSMTIVKLATALVAKTERKKPTAISLTKSIIALREKNS
jgi:hypothetical protein